MIFKSFELSIKPFQNPLALPGLGLEERTRPG